MSDLRPSGSAASNAGPVKRTVWMVVWLFPYFLAGLGYLAARFYSGAASLGTSVFELPIPTAVYGWLLLMVLASVAWLVGEFISVTGRETVVSALQMDAVFSSVTAILFTGFAGYFIGIGKLEWWFVVPWLATIIDAVTAAILSVNNAAQKPFLSKRGTE